MALMDVTPVMTSNTTPSPYVASASSEYSSDYAPFKAFDGNVETLWSASGALYNSWLQLDFGRTVSITTFKIMASVIEPTYNPTEFKLVGSINGADFKEIFTTTGGDWTALETRVYNLGRVYSYRYFRLEMTKNTPMSRQHIGLLQFFYDSDMEEVVEIPPVSHKNASLLCTTPMNTTKNILARTNDPRVGLLGMANDAENYGDLYVIGGDGKAHLTRSGIKSEVIFDGVASSVGNYDLLKNISNFKCLLVTCSVSTSAGTTGERSNVICVNNIQINKANAYDYGRVVGNYPNITYGFGEKILIVNGIAKGTYASVQVERVIGVY